MCGCLQTGGVYIPPAKMALLKEHMSQDKNSKEYQKMTWEALKKSLNGLINKVRVCTVGLDGEGRGCGGDVVVACWGGAVVDPYRSMWPTLRISCRSSLGRI